MKECVTILTTTNYYYLSEKYNFDEIIDKVSISASIDGWLTLLDSKENLICIKSSRIEAITITYDRPL